MDTYLIDYHQKQKFAMCKLILQALLWVERTEDLAGANDSNYSSELIVENQEWHENIECSDTIEHFRDISNSVRIGVWLDILLIRLTDLCENFPTCLHDASWYALLAITTVLVEKELEGDYINASNPTFTRSLALDCLEDVATSECRFGFPTLDFPMTLDEAKSLLPEENKEVLAVELEEYVRNSTNEPVETINLYSLRDILIDYFNMVKWENEINQKSARKLQDKYGEEYATGAYSVNTTSTERWGMTLVYLVQYMGFNMNFVHEESDLTLPSLPEAGNEYGILRAYVEKYADRSMTLLRLVHVLVYFILTGKYNHEVIREIILIPVSFCSSATLQGMMELAAYRVSYYMAANNIEEYEKGSKWLLGNFPDLTDFYQAGKIGAKNVV
jgi:hypothetical protein